MYTNVFVPLVANPIVCVVGTVKVVANSSVERTSAASEVVSIGLGLLAGFTVGRKVIMGCVW